MEKLQDKCKVFSPGEHVCCVVVNITVVKSKHRPDILASPQSRYVAMHWCGL